MAPRVLCLALAAAFLACGEEHDPGLIRAAGHVEATDVTIATKRGGTLTDFALDEGHRVTAGEVIARFDTTDAELAKGAATAERDLAAARLRLAEAGARREDVERARAELGRAEVELEAAERDLLRFQGLLDSGSGAPKARDDALARRDAAARAVAAARQVVLKLEAGTRREELEVARAAVAAAEARVAQVEQQIRDATVTAPRDGVVTEKLVEAGELLAPGTPLVVVTDLADAHLVAWIGEADLGRVRLGQEAMVVTDDGTRRAGQVTWISPRAEFTPKNVQTRDERVKLVYEVKIALANADGLYKPGMPAEAELRAAAGDGP